MPAIGFAASRSQKSIINGTARWRTSGNLISQRVGGLYTIARQDGVIVVVLEWFSHNEYERRFNY